MSDKVAIVTGANHGGIGYEMARTLARSGCTVVFACRDLNKARVSIGKIKSERTYVNFKCHAMHLDLASLKSVRTFADNFLRDFQVLDILILNAGMISKRFFYIRTRSLQLKRNQNDKRFDLFFHNSTKNPLGNPQ